MNEPQPNPDANLPSGPPVEPAPSAAEPIVYQPLSGFAVAGFAAGALFVLFVAACAVLALVQRTPMFLPLWLLGLAILGIVLSLIGERHVQNSEGTRAGAPLARWGFRLSLVSGLIYFAYFFVTGETLKSQANAFLMEKGDDAGFFPVLIEGAGKQTALNAAFLLTKKERTVRPENEQDMRLFFDTPSQVNGAGELTRFREGAFGRVFYKDLAKDAQVEPLAAQDWLHEKRSYKIYRNYRIQTKEVDLVVRMAVASAEAEAGQEGRRWYVNLPETQEVSRQFTDLGKRVMNLRQSACVWLDRSLYELRTGKAFADLKQADQTPWDLLIADPKKRAGFRDLMRRAWAADDKIAISKAVVQTQADEPGKWEQVGGKIRFALAVQMEFALTQTDKYISEGYVFVQSRQAIDPARFQAGDPQPDWELVSFTATMMLAKDGMGP